VAQPHQARGDFALGNRRGPHVDASVTNHDSRATNHDSRIARASSFVYLSSLVVIAFMSIAENISLVRERILAASHRSGRGHQEITLIAVTKTFAAPQISAAYDAGLRIFGENKVQEFAGKIQNLRDLDAEWHMIGHLQSNKAAKAAELFSHIDSVDSLRVAQRLNAAAGELDKKLHVLIEINIGGESVKSGLPADSSELQDLLVAAPDLPSLQIEGLMTVPPYNEDPELSRPYFRKMRALFEEVDRRKLPALAMKTLSMGMSHDFEIAIEEGATCVRIGTAIFGERPVARSKN